MIEAKNVIKKYDEVIALDDFSVEIPKRKIGILGPNGAGKSTFVKIALGLISATGGYDKYKTKNRLHARA